MDLNKDILTSKAEYFHRQQDEQLEELSGEYNPNLFSSSYSKK